VDTESERREPNFEAAVGFDREVAVGEATACDGVKAASLSVMR
jgi:hypothetical protein